MAKVSLDVNVLNQLIAAALKQNGSSDSATLATASVGFPGTGDSMVGLPAIDGNRVVEEVGRVSELGGEVVEVEVPEGASEAVQSVPSESGDSEGSVTFKPARPGVREELKRLQFGASVGMTVGASPETYYQAIRNPRTKALCASVSKFAGVKLNKNVKELLGLASYAAGAMPECIRDGRDRLKVLAMVGDAMIDFQLLSTMWQIGATVEHTQNAKSRASDVELSVLAHSSGLVHALAAPAGVNLRIAKTTASYIEALVGALCFDLTYEQIHRFLENIGMNFS